MDRLNTPQSEQFTSHLQAGTKLDYQQFAVTRPKARMDWIHKHIPVIEGFPRPKWDEIHKEASNDRQQNDPDEFWSGVAQIWIGKLLNVLPKEYQPHESDNFIIVTSESDRYVELFQSYLEGCLSRILRTLRGVANDEGWGKHIVIIFDDFDSYYLYAGFFYPAEGVFGMSSGMYINQGYGHFVFPNEDLNLAESVAAHEMTHAVLSHLPIPLWLNEGLAVNIEGLIAGFPAYQLDNKQFVRHQNFWNAEEIQTFWSGQAFSRPDEGQELSYQLAQLLVTKLSRRYATFVTFANQANWNDSGEQATKDVFGLGLGDLISEFLGVGKWSPAPDSWPKNLTDNDAGVLPKTRVEIL